MERHFMALRTRGATRALVCVPLLADRIYLRESGVCALQRGDDFESVAVSVGALATDVASLGPHEYVGADGDHWSRDVVATNRRGCKKRTAQDPFGFAQAKLCE